MTRVNIDRQPEPVKQFFATLEVAPDGGAVVHAFKQLDPRQPAQPHADQADLEAFIDRVQPGWHFALCHGPDKS